VNEPCSAGASDELDEYTVMHTDGGASSAAQHLHGIRGLILKARCGNTLDNERPGAFTGFDACAALSSKYTPSLFYVDRGCSYR
jgi:hypothetical protein